jgi:transcriptional regulator with XRE-family HTH domain
MDTPVSECTAVRLNHAAAKAYVLSKGTISDAARAVDEDRSHLSNVLAGRRNARPELIQRLAAYLGVNPYVLLGPEDPRSAVIELARLYEVEAADLEMAG